MAKHTHNTNKMRDLMNKIIFDPEERIFVFRNQSPQQQSQILLRLSKHILYDLLSKLPNKEIATALEFLDPDEATDILQSTSESQRKKVIEMMNESLQNDIQILFAFDPNTAGGIMNLDYIQVTDKETIYEVAKKFKAHEQRTGRLPVIIVTKGGILEGYIPGHELGFAKPSDVVKKYTKSIAGIHHSTTKEDVIELFKAKPHNKVAVLNDNGTVKGIIYSDDVLSLIEEQESASLYDFAGVHEEESVTDSTSVKVSHRYKWLIINLATSFLAAFIVGLFNETISRYVLLAVYMPIIAGMGGNAATQTLAILVRGIALNEIEFSTAWPVLKREIMAGMINGVINGVIVATVVLIVNRDIWLAVVLGIAMVTNLIVAGFFGTLIPLVMKSFGKDPATSATIFITTATDVLGFLVFLGLATLLLR
ncbi:magnesium transporter [Candidatus Woesebacteria bacterium]|nr:magnesium transporter [Candidatus Woesebacteria bacterium]